MLRRTYDNTASLIIDQATANAPDAAPLLLRAALDCRLEQALLIAKKQKSKRRLSPIEKLALGAKINGENASLIKLVEDEGDWQNVESLAEATPKLFLEHVWPWFTKVISLIAHPEHNWLFTYRDDPATYNEFGGELPHSPIVRSLLLAVNRLASQTSEQFLEFARNSWHSDLTIVHRLLAKGFQILAVTRTKVALLYLLGDRRRLEIGDLSDGHRESITLISLLSSRLETKDRQVLEERIVNFNPYKKIMPQWSAKDRRDRKMWARAHRLRLLQALSDEHISEEVSALRDQEERVFPGAEKPSLPIRFGWVGPRITAEQMAKATDDHLMNLFASLPDSTEFGNPKMRLSFNSNQAGGAWQLARELESFAKEKPERASALLDRLMPTLHETYAGYALQGLAQTMLPTTSLIAIITSLDGKGFSSEAFRRGAAEALKSRAMKENGLSAESIRILERWLRIHPIPELSDYKKTHNDMKGGRAILFSNGSWSSPPGRGSLIETIATGYLQQDPPNYEGWANLIKTRLGIEKHPAMWVKTLMYMGPLINRNAEESTALFESVIKRNPNVLDYGFALHSIARIIPLCDPKTRARGWIDMLQRRKSEFSQQAYGEVLFFYHCRYDDSWSRSQLQLHLQKRTAVSTLLGLAHGASHLWRYSHCRAKAERVLKALVPIKNPMLVKAVTDVFRLNSTEMELDPELRRFILKVLANHMTAVAAAEDLLTIIAPRTAEHPEIAVAVCRALLGRNRRSTNLRWSSVPEHLTTIALTLHRHKRFRATGLKIFESLLEMDLAEAKEALDVLDRNPTVKTALYRPKRFHVKDRPLGFNSQRMKSL